MENNQDDGYATRRAELEAQYQSLSPSGSGDYWQRIEETNEARLLPLEVLAQCCREQRAVGAFQDAQRIMNAIIGRVQRPTDTWARRVVRTAHGMRPELREELEQEAYTKLWQELDVDGPNYLLTNFEVAYLRLRQHVAQSFMEKEGEWQRKDVESPTRVPRKNIASLQARPADENTPSIEERLADPNAPDPFEEIGEGDLREWICQLPEPQRITLLDRVVEGLSQETTAAKLHVSTRMVRIYWNKALATLRARISGSEEADGV